MRYLYTSLIAAGIVLLGASAIASHNATQASTTQNFQSQKQQRIAKELAHAAQNKNKARDHGGVTHFSPPVPHPIAEPGIPIGPIPMTQSSAWTAGWYPDTMNEVLVLGGYKRSNPEQGMIDVQVLDQNNAPWSGEFLAPGQTGAITITNVQGTIIKWTSSSGASGSFNLASDKWGQS